MLLTKPTSKIVRPMPAPHQVPMGVTHASQLGGPPFDPPPHSAAAQLLGLWGWTGILPANQ